MRVLTTYFKYNTYGHESFDQQYKQTYKRNQNWLLTDYNIKELTGSFGVKDKQECTTSPWNKDESHSEKSEFQILLQVSKLYLDHRIIIFLIKQ